MRGTLKRLPALAVAVGAVTLMGVSAASASAAGTTCSSNTGTIKLSPGLEASPKVQNITIKGTLSGCTGSTVTEASYVAHLKTVNAASCADLKTAGAPATGTIVVKWSPKGQGNSQGTFGMPLTETPGASLSGMVEGGLFEGGAISGTVSETYAGGEKCGVANGKKKAKKVNKGTLTGTAFTIS